MATITCPRCETTFETKATTATRCRSCRSVVHVGQRRDGTSAARSQLPVARRAPDHAVDTDPAGSEEAVPAGVVLVAGIVLAACVAWLVGRWWKARSAQAKALEEAPGDPEEPS